MQLSGYNHDYQIVIFNTIMKALQDHPRTLAIRLDLRFPDIETEAETDPRVITRFVKSLKAKIGADLKRKSDIWGRNLSCELNYVWVREYGEINGKKHYHVLLFVNKDVYYSLGDYRRGNGNLSAMIRQAWCSATRLTHPDFLSLTHFVQVFHLNKNKADIVYQVGEVAGCGDYLAKNVTKRYGDGERSMGSSIL
tara:strand:+ start:24072 stop:24656 length:585 start_codon:yes stop_codon:yes gene_type:complete